MPVDKKKIYEKERRVYAFHFKGQRICKDDERLDRKTLYFQDSVSDTSIINYVNKCAGKKARLRYKGNITFGKAENERTCDRENSNTRIGRKLQKCLEGNGKTEDEDDVHYPSKKTNSKMIISSAVKQSQPKARAHKPDSGIAGDTSPRLPFPQSKKTDDGSEISKEFHTEANAQSTTNLIEPTKVDFDSCWCIEPFRKHGKIPAKRTVNSKPLLKPTCRSKSGEKHPESPRKGDVKSSTKCTVTGTDIVKISDQLCDIEERHEHVLSQKNVSKHLPGTGLETKVERKVNVSLKQMPRKDPIRQEQTLGESDESADSCDTTDSSEYATCDSLSTSEISEIDLKAFGNRENKHSPYTVPPNGNWRNKEARKQHLMLGDHRMNEEKPPLQFRPKLKNLFNSGTRKKLCHRHRMKRNCYLRSRFPVFGSAPGYGIEVLAPNLESLIKSLINDENRD